MNTPIVCHMNLTITELTGCDRTGDFLETLASLPTAGLTPAQAGEVFRTWLWFGIHPWIAGAD